MRDPPAVAFCGTATPVGAIPGMPCSIPLLLPRLSGRQIAQKGLLRTEWVQMQHYEPHIVCRKVYRMSEAAGPPHAPLSRTQGDVKCGERLNRIYE